ncbi:mCG1041282, partial [Mus musculus]
RKQKKSLIFKRDNTGAFVKISSGTFHTEHTIISTYKLLHFEQPL